MDQGQDDRPVRMTGLTTGAALAAMVIAGAYGIAAVPAVEAVLNIRVALSSEGLSFGLGAMWVVAWAVGPLAAGIAGWLFAVPAAGRARYAGPWMGASTYVLALLLAASAFVFVPAMTPDGATAGPVDVVRLITGIPFVAMLGIAAFVPLGAVCLVAGTAWAVIVRRLAAGRWEVGPVRDLPALPIIALGALAVLGWFAASGLLAGIGEEPLID